MYKGTAEFCFLSAAGSKSGSSLAISIHGCHYIIQGSPKKRFLQVLLYTINKFFRKLQENFVDKFENHLSQENNIFVSNILLSCCVLRPIHSSIRSVALN